LIVSAVVNAPWTAITRINVTFVTIAHNIVQPNPSSTGTVGVANEPTAASSCMVNSSSSNNDNKNRRYNRHSNDNLGKPGSADVWATSHLGSEDWLTWVGQLGDNVSAGKYLSGRPS